MTNTPCPVSGKQFVCSSCPPSATCTPILSCLGVCHQAIRFSRFPSNDPFLETHPAISSKGIHMTICALFLTSVLFASFSAGKDASPVSPTAQGLIDAGKKYPEAHVCQSQPHPLLMELASEQARYQAQHQTQGHEGFPVRCQKIEQAGLESAAEICAESWSWQRDESMLNLGTEMFKCWRQSSGHWAVACRKHKWFGAEMAEGRNGIWYATIIVAD